MLSLTSLSDERFSALFRDFAHTAWRLETLQRYGVEYEDKSFQDFLSGVPRYTDPAQREWVDNVSAMRALGKRMGRVHIVEEPLSDYIRFEMLWPYRDSVEGGEDVRVLPVPAGEWPEDLPREDYWLFDSRLAVVMNYAPDGRFISADFVEDSGRLVEYNYWRDVAEHLAVSYQEYVPRVAQ